MKAGALLLRSKRQKERFFSGFAHSSSTLAHSSPWAEKSAQQQQQQRSSPFFRLSSSRSSSHHVCRAELSFTERRRRFRALLAGDKVLFPASAFDAMSIRIAEDVGYECGILAGSTAAGAVLASPDLMLLTLTELAQQVRSMTRASSLPLFCDADSGYGNALSCMRTVQELECAGVCGLTIEDTGGYGSYAHEGSSVPGSAGGYTLLSVDEGAGKLRAAVAARLDPELLIIARTSAHAAPATAQAGGEKGTGVAEVVRRLQVYRETGIDAFMLIGAFTTDELALCSQAAGGLPIILSNAGPAGAASAGGVQALAKYNVRIVLQGHQPFAAAQKAVRDTYLHLRNETSSSAPLQRGAEGVEVDDILMEKTTRSLDYVRWQQDYLALEKPHEGL